MPSLQLDVPAAYDAAATRELARRLGAVYAEVIPQLGGFNRDRSAEEA